MQAVNQQEVQAAETSKLFTNIRLGVFVTLGLLAAGVLGIAIHFATIFPSSFHHSFNTFAIVAPAVTIVLLIIILLRSTPCWDCVALAVLDILWLTMGAWSTDVIGNLQCESLTGQQTPTKNGQTSFQGWCQQMKVVEAFSWANFGILTICLLTVIFLVVRLFSMGFGSVWSQSVAELEWFHNPHTAMRHGMGMSGMGGMGMGGMNGMNGMASMGAGNMSGMGAGGFMPMAADPMNNSMGGGFATAQQPGTQYVKQVPGHSVVINGSGAPTGAAVTQLPTHTSSSHHGRGRSRRHSSSSR